MYLLQGEALGLLLKLVITLLVSSFFQLLGVAVLSCRRGEIELPFTLVSQAITTTHHESLLNQVSVVGSHVLGTVLPLILTLIFVYHASS